MDLLFSNVFLAYLCPISAVFCVPLPRLSRCLFWCSLRCDRNQTWILVLFIYCFHIGSRLCTLTLIIVLLCDFDVFFGHYFFSIVICLHFHQIHCCYQHCEHSVERATHNAFLSFRFMTGSRFTHTLKRVSQTNQYNLSLVFFERLRNTNERRKNWQILINDFQNYSILVARSPALFFTLHFWALLSTASPHVVRRYWGDARKTCKVFRRNSRSFPWSFEPRRATDTQFSSMILWQLAMCVYVRALFHDVVRFSDKYSRPSILFFTRKCRKSQFLSWSILERIFFLILRHQAWSTWVWHFEACWISHQKWNHSDYNRPVYIVSFMIFLRSSF